MKTEKILVALAIVAFIMKLIPVAGGNEILMIDLSILSSVYFGGSFYFFSDQGLKNQKIGLSIAAGVALSIVVVGFLFNILGLSGGNEMLVVGLPAAFLILITVMVLLGTRKENDLKVYYANMVVRLTFWCFMGLAIYYVPYEAIIKIRHRRHPELVRLEILRHNSTNNEDDEKYEKQIKAYHEKQDSLERIR